MYKRIITYLFLFWSLLWAGVVYGQETFIVEPVNFNTGQKEYAPVYFQNGIVFCGVGSKSTAFTFVDAETGKLLTDLFFISSSTSHANEKRVFSTSLQTSFHDGPITFSEDGNVAYFTRSLSINKKLKNSIKSQNRLGVFKSTFDGEEWSNITPCNFNSNEYNVGQPCLSKDGKTLYVVSDKEGGYGGKDIYYSELIDGEFGPLINMGPKVNSVANEMFPSLYASNQLYFSSDRAGGFGGLDFYITAIEENQRNSTLVLDSLLNTAFDDFSIVFKNSGEEGYFASNRNGSDDIFKLTIQFPEFKNCEEVKTEQLCYEFYEEATLNVDSVAMLYQWDFGDGNKKEGLEVYHCYSQLGLYLVELNILDPVIDKVFVNKDTYELEIEEIFQPLINCPDTVFLNDEIKVEVEQGKWLNYKIDNYYVRFEDSVTVKNNFMSFKFDSVGTNEIQVLISGLDTVSNTVVSNCFYKTIYIKDDTDEAAVEHSYKLLKFDENRVSEIEENDESYFALELLKSTTSIKGDSSKLKNYVNEAREMFHQESNDFSYLLGKTDVPFDLIEKYRKAHNSGFENAEVKQFKNDSNEIIMYDFGVVETDSLGNTSIVLKNIYFNYGSHQLTSKSKKELNKLVTYLKLNVRKVEVGAHTDNKGNYQYNIALSQKRAKNVADYLIEKGIDKSMLESKGYGESLPKAPNQNKDGTDSPEGREQNRRVTIRFL
jgi:outer membrane protein OmpA-like peptidoglycan-associated protein